MSDVIQYIVKLKDEMSGSLKSIEHNTDSLNNTMKKVGLAIGTYFAVEKIVEFGKESYKAYSEAQVNVTKLTSAVKTLGGTSSDVESLVAQSSALQDKGIFSDDATQQIQTMAIQFGLTSKQVQEMTPIVEDFAAATGQSTESAMQSVLMGTNGMMRGMKAYGINLKDTGDKTKNLQAIIGELGVKFKGSNELIAKTTEAGKMAQFTNQMDDLHEVVGEGLAAAFSVVMPYIIDFVRTLKEALPKLMPYVQIIVDGISSLIDVFKNNSGAIASFFQPIIEVVMAFVNQLKPVIARLIASVMEWMPQIQALLYGLRDGFVWVLKFVEDITLTLIDMISVILDVAHTFYVLLDKLGVIDFIIGLFKMLWSWAKLVGEMFLWVYSVTLKPILDAIGWAYDKLKDLLGLTSKAKVTVESTTKAVGETKAPTTAVAGAGMVANNVTKAGASESKVTGSKNTTIQITIQKFIDGGINITTTTLKESASEMQSMIAKALLNAVNDAQIIATQ